ncbi:MAG TPA: S41 family peptidase [Candidatus Eisenbacteria bacterium]|jgi:carboxyl-terminal processing protease|nr:S41 family peptidase [Candidatus Eisenbacteria bacterium]
MNRAARIGILSLSVAIFCYAGIGHVLGRTPDDRAYKSLSVYGEVLQRIQSDYVDEPNMRLVTAGSLHGLLESLDPQSSYLTPREYTEFKQKQQSSGTGETGLTLSKRFGYVIVISVLPESSAEKAGIHSGDIFESIASFTTRDMSVGQALNLLNGPAGSGVKVGVIRRGKAEPESVDLVREKLVPAKTIVQKSDPDILVLRVPSLDAGRAEELRNKLQEAEKQGIHKVILDLRACGRGPVSEAVAVARLFVPSGNIATLRGQTVSSQTFAAEPGKVVWKGPVSVLIDGTTSGAPEVVASAMVINKRGDVVGERSFGLASEQKLITMDDGSALSLTVANYYNPAGKPILEEGVEPTEVVRAGTVDDDSDVDDDGGKNTPAKVTPSGPRPLSPEDPIFRKALELLKNSAKKAA